MAATEAQHSASRAGDIVRLEHGPSRTSVSISPSAGNVVFEMRIDGHNVLWFPFDSIEEFKAAGHGRAGIPFLGPWANRLDEQAFYANGRRFAFDMTVGNVRGEIPIHGLLMETDRWRVRDMNADDSSAWVTSRLEFYREPLWMKQFPFAHSIDMTHRLENGVLAITTTIENMSAEPMPLSIGFHPYFQLPGSDRSEWVVTVPAQRRWRLAVTKAPNGETEAVKNLFPGSGGGAGRGPHAGRCLRRSRSRRHGYCGDERGAADSSGLTSRLDRITGRLWCLRPSRRHCAPLGPPGAVRSCASSQWQESAIR